MTNPVASRLASYLQIGGSHGQPLTRYVGEVWPKSWGPSREPGVAGYIKRRVLPDLEWGAKWLWLQWPFGLSEDGASNKCELDAWSLAKSWGQSHLTSKFASEWRRITRQGIRVTCYLGNAAQSAALTRHLERGQRATWLRRVTASLGPVLDAGMDIGLDASINEDEDSTTFALAELLRSMGVVVFCENRPDAARAHWARFGTVCDERCWQDRERGIGLPAVHRDAIHGEIVRALYYADNGRDTPPIDEILRDAPRILADGDCCLLNVLTLREAGVSLDALLSQEVEHGA